MTDVPRVVVVMGVSGSGKTTVGELVAERLGWEMLEGDSLHPPANVEKMSAGVPLTDHDRWPWLETIATWIGEHVKADQPAVVSCSSLKRSYRNLLRSKSAEGQVAFALLNGSAKLLEERMAHRAGHFMPASLLASQLATLEPLQRDEFGVTVDLVGTPEEQAGEIIARLGLDRAG